MASGDDVSLVSGHFPYLPIRITLEARPTESYSVEAFIDTGFDGDVILPVHVLGGDMEPDAFQTWILADDSRVTAGYFRATLELPGLPGRYQVRVSILGGEPMVGSSLTNRFLLTLDHGRSVSIAL